jgi:hypothetical protein
MLNTRADNPRRIHLDHRYNHAARQKDLVEIANISFITSEVNRSINQMGPEVYLKGIRPDILANQCIPERDREADTALRAMGWSVMRFWDFEIQGQPGPFLATVLWELRSRGWKPSQLGPV